MAAFVDLNGNSVSPPLRNIIASYKPESPASSSALGIRGLRRRGRRTPGAAHSRANDGGSGVAVLLEMARHFSSEIPR
ncbi:MAG: hypothetical protein R3B47_06990 [Bacteroidia bacterium]